MKIELHSARLIKFYEKVAERKGARMPTPDMAEITLGTEEGKFTGYFKKQGSNTKYTFNQDDVEGSVIQEVKRFQGLIDRILPPRIKMPRLSSIAAPSKRKLENMAT